MANAFRAGELCLGTVSKLYQKLGQSNPVAYKLAIRMMAALRSLEIDDPLKMDEWINGQPLVCLPVGRKDADSAKEAIEYVQENFTGPKRMFFSAYCQFVVSYSRHGLPVKADGWSDPDDKIAFFCFLKNVSLTDMASRHREEDHTSFTSKLAKYDQEFIPREQFDSMFREVVGLIPDEVRQDSEVEYQLDEYEKLGDENPGVLSNYMDYLLDIVREAGGSSDLIGRLNELVLSARKIR